MSTTTRKPQKAFIAVTLLTVIAVTTVFMVYAVLLASYTGGDITITGIGGNIEYAPENIVSSFHVPPFTQGAKAQWYTRIAITGSPNQQVTVTWTLYNGTQVVTTDFTTTNILLTTSTQYIYASSNGLIGSNHNWGDHSLVAGTAYRVDAQIEYTP